MAPEAAKKEFERAQKELDRQDCVKAIQHLESGLRLYDQSATALNELGNCRRKLGDLPGAESAFKRAMGLGNATYIAMNLAETLTAQQKFTEAEAMLQETIRKTADNGGAYYALSIAYFKQDRLHEAEVAALQADARNHLPDLHLLLAKIYAKSDADKTVKQLELYLKEAPNGTQSKAVREALQRL
jgi:tetratricopeptide (TPR) repeat protein